jgi:hypothetical protein
MWSLQDPSVRLEMGIDKRSELGEARRNDVQWWVEFSCSLEGSAILFHSLRARRGEAVTVLPLSMEQRSDAQTAKYILRSSLGAVRPALLFTTKFPTSHWAHTHNRPFFLPPLGYIFNYIVTT